eukprot:353583-Chlamydomonas_euryale.AAC.4
MLAVRRADSETVGRRGWDAMGRISVGSVGVDGCCVEGGERLRLGAWGGRSGRNLPPGHDSHAGLGPRVVMHMLLMGRLLGAAEIACTHGGCECEC